MEFENVPALGFTRVVVDGADVMRCTMESDGQLLPMNNVLRHHTWHWSRKRNRASETMVS